MIDLDDDFDLDEDFLKGTIDIESQIGNNLQRSQCNKPSTSKPVLEKKHEDTVQEKSPKKNNTEFLDLWNSNEGKQFFSKSPDKFSNPKIFLDTLRAVSPVGVRSEVVTRVSKNVRQRKFPGPAGLLPERTSSTSLIAAEEYLLNTEDEDDSFEGKEVLSQATNDFFEHPGSAWRNMVHDLGPQGNHLISTINLGSVKIKHARFGFKVPFLAVCIENIDCSLPDPSLHLKDKTDEIYGTLHRDVWEEWKGELVVGSVLVLRNTGVISTGTSSRRFFLNITANNIITIYTPKHDSGIKITTMQSSCGLNTKEVLEEWERVMTQTRLQQLGSDSPQSHSLYKSVPTVSPVGPPFNNLSPSINRPFTPPFRPTFKPHVSLSHQRPPSRFNSPRARPPLHMQQNSPYAQQGLQRMPFNSHKEMSQNIPKTLQFKTISNQSKHPSVQQPQTSFSLKKPLISYPNNGNGLTSNINNQQKDMPKLHSLLDGQSSRLYSETNNVTSCLNKTEADEPSVPVKKPKMSNKIENLSRPSPSTVFSISPANQSVLDSALDGIDTDSFFDEF